MRLFTSHDKPRKGKLRKKRQLIQMSLIDKFILGFLTNDEFYSLFHDNGIHLNKSDEDYYQLFSKYDRQLRDQFNYSELFRTIINTIMS
jgi:hypothetical protein